MTGIALQDMRDVAADLRAAVLEHDSLCIELARAEIEHKRQYLEWVHAHPVKAEELGLLRASWARQE